jgi:hypothetical protein
VLREDLRPAGAGFPLCYNFATMFSGQWSLIMGSRHLPAVREPADKEPVQRAANESPLPRPALYRVRA